MAKITSLAAKSGAVETADGQAPTVALQLPSIFSAPPEQMKRRFTAPYVVFAHPKRADEWKRITSEFKGVEEGDMFLMRQDRIVKPDALKCTLIAARQYWAEANPAGQVLRTTFTEQGKPFKEHIEAVLLIYLEEEMIAANIQVRTTKTGGIRMLNETLALAATAAWGDESAAHKETLIINQPFGRFYGLLTLGEKRSSKTSGLPYKPLVCEIHPTSIPEWRLLDAFAKNVDAQKMLNDAAERFTSRMTEVQKMAK